MRFVSDLVVPGWLLILMASTSSPIRSLATASAANGVEKAGWRLIQFDDDSDLVLTHPVAAVDGVDSPPASTSRMQSELSKVALLQGRSC
jgi:hypothetical protein